MKLSRIVLALLVVAPVTLAEPDMNTPVVKKPDWQINFSMDLMEGGDELASVDFDDGRTEDVNAGGGIGFGAGLQYHVNEQVDTEFRLNYLVDSVKGETAYGNDFNLKFDAFPLDLMGFYHGKKHSIGAGLTYHMKPTFDVDGHEFGFDNALGMLVEYRYMWKRSVGLTVKYQDIEYTLSGSDYTVDGSGFGIGLIIGLTLK